MLRFKFQVVRTFLAATMSGTWEQRWHPLRREWIIIAAHRQNRPWVGHEVESDAEELPEHVPDCYLCPGNYRVGGKRNPDYSTTFVFDNDHPCVGSTAPTELESPAGIYQNSPARGTARVVCYTPRHNVSLSEMSIPAMAHLLEVLRDEYLDLGSRPEIEHVLIFENRGKVVGVSNPHPHCQIYATNFVFKTIELEAAVSRQHLRETGRLLFQEILLAEQEDGRRIITENGSAVGFVPYFARYAYEVYVAPRESHPSLAALAKSEIHDLASVLKTVLVKFDNLWRMPFPYVMCFHQAPTDGGDYRSFHFHIEFHPPLRKPNLLKYLAGPEIGGGNFVSDTCPEEKAAQLKAQPATHYKASSRTREP